MGSFVLARKGRPLYQIVSLYFDGSSLEYARGWARTGQPVAQEWAFSFLTNPTRGDHISAKSQLPMENTRLRQNKAEGRDYCLLSPIYGVARWVQFIGRSQHGPGIPNQ